MTTRGLTFAVLDDKVVLKKSHLPIFQWLKNKHGFKETDYDSAVWGIIFDDVILICAGPRRVPADIDSLPDTVIKELVRINNAEFGPKAVPIYNGFKTRTEGLLEYLGMFKYYI